MAVKGKRYKVLSDSDGFFKPGNIVIPIEDSNVPFCVYEDRYVEEKSVFEYGPDDYSPLSRKELVELESEDKQYD